MLFKSIDWSNHQTRLQTQLRIHLATLRTSRLALLGFSLLSFSGLSGCSNVRVAYYFADTFALSKIEETISLTAEQRKLTGKLLRQELKRAVVHGVPKFAELSREHFRLLENSNLNIDELNSLASKTENTVLAMLPAMEPAFAEFFLTLNEKQWNQLTTFMTKKTDKWAMTLRADEDRLKEGQKRFENWAKWNVSPVDFAKQNWILPDLVKADYPWDLELRDRRKFITLVTQASKNPQTIKALVSSICNDPLGLRSPEYAKAYSKWKERNRMVQLKYIQSMPKEEKQKWIVARKTLISDLEELRKKEMSVQN